LIACRGILTLLSALATIAALATADIRESRATTDLSREAPRTGRQPPRQPAPVAEAPAPTTPPQLSACQQRLTPDFVLMHPLAPITGPGSCGADDVVRLDAVVLKDGQRIALAPAPTLRCPMAEAVAHWIREEVTPAAATFGSPAHTIVTGTSYECRGRDRVPGAKLSEHCRANALDLRGLRLANGRVVDFTDTAVPKEFRELIRQSACTRFTTVLGPGSDAYHEGHIHLDLIERQGGYRLCQWDVLTAPGAASAPKPPKQPPASKGAK
jgi:hypothetical protein